MTVTELREALQKLEAEGKGGWSVRHEQESGLQDTTSADPHPYDDWVILA